MRVSAVDRLDVMASTVLRRLSELVDEEELAERPLSELFRKYIGSAGSPVYEIWFYDLSPPEIEVALPTTDAKLNYLAHTANVAAELRYRNLDGKRMCAHAELIARRRERFAQILSKFLDLHQILGALEPC